MKTRSIKNTGPWIGRVSCKSVSGYVLLELVIVLMIILLLVSLVSLDVVGLVQRSRLDEDVAGFTRTLRLASEQAVFSGKTLAVVIEVTDGYYWIYEENSEDRYDRDVEPLVGRASLDRSYIDTIEFEDGTRQYSGEVILKATPQGWSGSVLFNLIDDRNNRRRYVRCDRLTTHVESSVQPLELPERREEVSMTVPI